MKLKDLKFMTMDDHGGSPSDLRTVSTAEGLLYVRKHPTDFDAFIVSNQFDCGDDALYPHTIISSHVSIEMAEQMIQLLHQQAVEDFIFKWIQE